MSLEPKGPQRTLSVFALVMITTGIITSIHGAPSMADCDIIVGCFCANVRSRNE